MTDSITRERPVIADRIVEALASPDVQKEHFGDEASAKRYINEIVDAQMKAYDKDTQATYASQTAEVLAEFLAKAGYSAPDGSGRPPVGGSADAPEKTERFRSIPGYSHSVSASFQLGSKNAPGAAISPVYHEKLNSSPGEFMRAASKFDLGDKVAAARLELSKANAATYNSGVGSEGGFLLPEEMRDMLITAELEESILLGKVTTLPMSGRQLSLPMIDVSSHVGSLFGGVRVYWRGESDPITKTAARFGVVKLEPNTVIGATSLAVEHMEDTNFLDAYFTSTFPQALAHAKDSAFLVGNGIGQPLGILNAPGRVEVSAMPGQAAGTVVYQNITRMWSRMLPASKKRAIWVASPEVEVELMEMALDVGTGGSAVWLTNAVGAPPLTIFGRPVYSSEKVPALGDLGDISFIDPTYYLHGDRQGPRMEQSNIPGWDEHEHDFKVTERYDGRPWFRTALTPANGGPTLSPVVVIEKR